MNTGAMTQLQHRCESSLWPSKLKKMHTQAHWVCIFRPSSKFSVESPAEPRVGTELSEAIHGSCHRGHMHTHTHTPRPFLHRAALHPLYSEHHTGASPIQRHQEGVAWRARLLHMHVYLFLKVLLVLSQHGYLKASYTPGPCLKSHFCLSKVGIKADNVIVSFPYLQWTHAEGVFMVRRHFCELMTPKRLRLQQDSSTKLPRWNGQQQCSVACRNLLALNLQQG